MATDENRAGRKARHVDWSEWAHARELRVWEAVAVSLNIEPTKVRLQNHSWMAGRGAFGTEEGAEFDKRLRMAIRALDHELKLASIVMGEPARCGVYLAQFAAWVRDVVLWEVPSELVELAGPQAVELNAPISSPYVSGEPAPLSTGDLASLLDGIERAEASWQRMLGDPPKWLLGARVSRGAPGPRAPAAWNPVNVGLALQSRGAPAAKLRAIFKHRLAAHWADEWARANQAADDAGI